MIKMIRDAHDDTGAVMFKEGEIVCATGVEEDTLVRRNYAEWHEAPPVNTENAAVEGDEA